MATVDYNQVINAFIDAVPFGKIPNYYKNDNSLTPLTGRDSVCAAVRTMILEWQNLWNHNGANFEKITIIQKVDDARELMVRKEEEKALIDEMHICELLSDMIPEYKDGTYNRLLSERETFLVTRMAQFLVRAGVPVPETITQFITEHEGALLH